MPPVATDAQASCLAIKELVSRICNLDHSLVPKLGKATLIPKLLVKSKNTSGQWCLHIQKSFKDIHISPALQPNSKRTICDWQRLGPAAWISDRVLPTWFPESINRPHIRAGVLKISRGTDNVKSSCTHRQSTRKRTCANLLTIVPTAIAAQ